MPAAALIVPALEFVATEAGVLAAGETLAGTVGAALGASTAAGSVLGVTTVANVVGGAVIGAGVGAATSAIQGGDIGQGFLLGGITGGAGPVISGAASSLVGPEVAGSTTLAKGLSGALSGAGKGALGAALQGGDVGMAALTGGLGGGITGAATEGLGLGKFESGLLGGGVNYALGQAFAPDALTRRAISASPVTPTTSPTITGQTSTTQSSAPIGGALLASPTLGYTPGSSFLGGTDSSKPSQNVWNQASLKEGAQVGPGSDGSQAQSS